MPRPISSPPPADPEFTDSPLYWFTRLDLAVERGDHGVAADAQRELERLGVWVRYVEDRRVLLPSYFQEIAEGTHSAAPGSGPETLDHGMSGGTTEGSDGGRPVALVPGYEVLG